MSLSEKDREILLHEIQQIQQTLESTGRSFGTCASDEDDEAVQNWTGINEGSIFSLNLVCITFLNHFLGMTAEKK